YILTVGDLQPRKNQTGLIRAYEQLVRNHPEIRHSLVLVGKQTWHAPQVLEAARRSDLANRIVFTGWVSDEELLQIYGGCDLFVFPSFYEGFGLPILEAMACGRAVACSGTSAMPEVADSAAILFDPRSVEEMVRAMRDVLLDAGLRGRLERLGLQRASLFSWDRAARRTLDVYYDVAGRSMRERSERARSVPVTIHD
ncbi:MAG TPA: glycosyltransferase family 1 protein, partial [Bryobacteraceae bacterium]|nr:glycosyltransferase family 1 protein [Bryobacteraceae bacterium]